MAKRLYTPKQISPEVARENEIGAVKSQLANLTRMIAADRAALAKGRFADPIDDAARIARQIASFEADVAGLDTRLATLMAG